MRRLPWVAFSLVALAAGLAAGAWGLRQLEDDSSWVVSATLESSDAAEVACGDLPGIGERLGSISSEPSPEGLSAGVYWTVKGRGRADDVAACLRELGAIEVTVKEDTGELKSFEPTGP